MMDQSLLTLPAQEFETMFRRLMSGVHTSCPGVIKAFDGRFATVQPAIKMQAVIAGQPTFIDMPVIVNVPVVVPQSQSLGLSITVPILPGDECLLIYAERAIDNFVQHGGVQPPILTADQSTAQGRTHDITDAICIPGIMTGAHLIADYSQNAIEIRDKTRGTCISVSAGVIKMDGTVICSNGDTGAFMDQQGNMIYVANGIIVGGLS